LVHGQVKPPPMVPFLELGAIRMPGSPVDGFVFFTYGKCYIH
jgi:hypothetical protein